MGLDNVELVMSVEDAFDIEIDDTDASGLVTVGLLHEYVVGALRKKGESVSPDKVFDQLRAIVVDQLGIPPDRVVRGARFVPDLRID